MFTGVFLSIYQGNQSKVIKNRIIVAMVQVRQIPFLLVNNITNNPINNAVLIGPRLKLTDFSKMLMELI